ncbi:MAG: hypothetical protein R3F39_25605, partial [Myxococcota bacterium]
LRSIEVDGGVVLRSVLAPTALLQFAAGWLLLFVSAFLLGARPSASARPRWLRLSVVLPLLMLLPLGAFGLNLMSAPPPTPRALDCSAGLPRMQAHATIEASPQGAEPAYTAHINALGLRGPERDPARPAILVVGDSFVHGSAVEDDQTIPAHLERALPQYQALNAGIEGDNLVGALSRARAWLDPVQPAALVIGIYTNDGTHGASTALCALPPCCRREVSWHLIDRLESAAQHDNPPDPAWLRGEVTREWGALAEALRARDIPVVFYVFRRLPRDLDLGWFAAPEARSATVMGGCVDDAHYFDPQSSHPNPAGTACMAGEIAAALRPLLAR